ncbi:MAG: SGNH/GDSL hydrolase family protein [Planctomycetota bacterium]|nr:SGNH/GDSL hydrolase family protein [Planctomycetota bacterium]
MRWHLAFTSVVMIIATQVALHAEGALAVESRWEAAIQAFEQQDAEQMPRKNGIVFVGSSSIRKWDLKKSFPDLNAINRGFGGSEMSDSVEFAERIVLKYEPRVVVVYAGDNDIAHDKTPQRVRDDFQRFVELIRAKLPKTKILYIAVKPSIKRWALIDQVRETNRLITEVAAKDDRLEFVDIDKPMLGADGMPRKELFVADGLHLSDEGYAIWTSLVKPYLTSD